MDNTKLIAALEGATADNHDLMLLSFKALNPISMCWDVDEGQVYEEKLLKFRKMLLAEAYESAALTLLPDEYRDDWCLGHVMGEPTAYLGVDWRDVGCSDYYASGATPALAICIAAWNARP